MPCDAYRLPVTTGAACAAGDDRRVIERIEPLRPRVIEVGGSRAPRDVFHDAPLEACLGAGDIERAERPPAERVARRPYHVWKTRTGSQVAPGVN